VTDLINIIRRVICWRGSAVVAACNCVWIILS